ncbi:MAG: TetR/AcrR family transcriptional regulator, partial [Bdellovibrionales bacterium]|nr:TetR/AcrR family transcriptional regulator [Bdellovibrionales bacterium]
MDGIGIENWFKNQDLTKGQATQLRIMQAALQLFSQRGFSNVTLQMIAENSNTSHPLILKHFGSKDELLMRVRQFVSASNHAWVDAKIKPDMSGKEALFTHCYENLRWAFEKPAEGKVILLTYYNNSITN